MAVAEPVPKESPAPGQLMRFTQDQPVALLSAGVAS